MFIFLVLSTALVMNNALPVMGKSLPPSDHGLMTKDITFVKDPWEVNKGRSPSDAATLFREYIPTEFSVKVDF